MRNRHPLWIAVGLIACMVEPALSAETLVDFDKSADFQKYSSYGWMPGTEAGSSRVESGIHHAVAQTLEAHGLSEDDESPDLYVVTHTALGEEIRLDVESHGYAGGLRWRGWRAWGPTTVNVERVAVGTLIVDLVDGASKELVWRGIASDSVPPKPEKVEKKVSKALQKLFKGFPPAAAGP